MKLKDTNLKSIIYTILLKNITYILWFSFAIITVAFLSNEIDKKKVTILIIVLIIVFLVRNVFRMLYIKVAKENYHSIKHSVEMYYFNNLKYVNNSRIAKMDKEYLSNKILEVAYNVTKAINDIGEYIIPCIIGTIILLSIIGSYSLLVALITLVMFVVVIVVRYKQISKTDEIAEVPNYNDLLKDYILKIKTIRKLNIFDYCTKTLDHYKDNELIVVKSNDSLSD